MVVLVQLVEQSSSSMIVNSSWPNVLQQYVSIVSPRSFTFPISLAAIIIEKLHYKHKYNAAFNDQWSTRHS